MKRRLRIPIRVRFMLTFLILVTAVVGAITFSTASLFQDDKKAYVNGLTSMVALGTAEEARSTLIGYHERLRLYARLMLDERVAGGDREATTRTLFEEFPELVSVTLTREDEELLAVSNTAILDEAGLTQEDLRRLRQTDPSRLDSLDQGQALVGNSTPGPELACFTLAFRQPAGDEGPATTVTGVLLSNRLQSLASRFSAYEQFLTDSAGVILAHSNLQRVVAHEIAELPAEAAAIHADFSAGVTLEYERRGVPLIAGFGSLDFGDMIAGVEIPASAANLASQRILSRMMLLAAALLVTAIVTGFVWAHRITRPMERLSGATRRIAKGNFDVQLDVESSDEMGDLAGSFNQMALELKGREIELKEALGQLVQSEKMAAFGQLGAGIAHEVKNPLGGILGCTQLSLMDVEPDSPVHENLVLIERETRRCTAIVENLMKFARQEEAVLEPTDVNAVVEDAAAIVNHQMELRNVKVFRELDADLPQVNANANQLQQVLMNLMINAQQAMDGAPGCVTISTRAGEAGGVEIEVADDGPGMPEGVRSKVFEPFFTTKPVGKGTGLGLSVTFGIIRDHGGEIGVESEIGKGTTFRIHLPASRVLQVAEPVGRELAESPSR